MSHHERLGELPAGDRTPNRCRSRYDFMAQPQRPERRLWSILVRWRLCLLGAAAYLGISRSPSKSAIPSYALSAVYGPGSLGSHATEGFQPRKPMRRDQSR
jgi:hypothetical protein